MLLAIALHAYFASQQAKPAQKKPSELKVSFQHMRSTTSPGVTEFTGKVTATYGPTLVTSDGLKIFYDKVGDSVSLTKGEAKGKVYVSDPLGTLNADEATFDVRAKSGTASNAKIITSGVEIKAGKIFGQGDRWTLTDLDLTNISGHPPLYSLHAEKAVVKFGKQITFTKGTFRLFNMKILTLNTARVSLDKRESGLAVPTASYSRGQGLGVNWNSTILLGEQSSVSGLFNAYSRSRPSFGAQLTHSLVPSYEGATRLNPRSDLDERFPTSYFEDVVIRSPEASDALLMDRRQSISVGAIYNRDAVGRDDGHTYSKPFDLVYEQGMGFKSGLLKGGGVLGQLAYDVQKRDSEAAHGRTYATLMAVSGRKEIAKNTWVRLRYDGTAYVGKGTFSWSRIELGGATRPLPNISFGLAGAVAAHTGTPQFLADDLLYFRVVSLRGDYDNGKTRVSLIGKYSFDKHTWFDKEYQVSQLLGGLEVYARYRKYPSDYRLGINLRLDEFFDKLQARRQEIQGAK